MSTDPQQQKDRAPTPEDPALDPQRPDSKAGASEVHIPPAGEGSSSQLQSQSQSQGSEGQSQDSEKSAYVPDYEPQHKPQTQRNLQPTQGHDADIDTQGG